MSKYIPSKYTLLNRDLAQLKRRHSILQNKFDELWNEHTKVKNLNKKLEEKLAWYREGKQGRIERRNQQ